jgi:hypothetical protein
MLLLSSLLADGVTANRGATEDLSVSRGVEGGTGWTRFRLLAWRDCGGTGSGEADGMVTASQE